MTNSYKIIIFQRKFSLVTSIFVILHPIFFIISTKSIVKYILPDFTTTPLAIGILSLYLFICIMIASLLYKRISYSKWQYIHILTYILFGLSLYHILTIGSDIQNLKIIYAFLFAMLCIGIIYRTTYKIKQKKYKFTVSDIQKETHNVFTIKTNKTFSFKPGQFCFLRLNKNKLYARHPFTISSSNLDKELSFTVKLKGKFTEELYKLQKNEEIFIDGPFGIFTIEDKTKNLVFIAGGVGITPFMSMIRSQLQSNTKQNITLLYAAKTEEDLIFKEELDKINKDWFKVRYILSREESTFCKNGYIDKDIVEKEVKDIKNSVFYLCCPEKMKKSLKKSLINVNNIKTESFFW